jgi:hypothetical protein
MSQLEPGLNRHEWETEWQALEEELADSPRETLPELTGLLERMLVDNGIAVDDPIAREGTEREYLAEFEQARDTARRVEAGEDVDPGDVAAAVNGLRELYEHLIETRKGAP